MRGGTRPKYKFVMGLVYALLAIGAGAALGLAIAYADKVVLLAADYFHGGDHD